MEHGCIPGFHDFIRFIVTELRRLPGEALQIPTILDERDLARRLAIREFCLRKFRLLQGLITTIRLAFFPRSLATEHTYNQQTHE